MNALAVAFRRTLSAALGTLAVAAILAGTAAAAAPHIDPADLSVAGFKVLVATNKTQEEWVHKLPPDKIRAMQRTGKKFFVYPDAPRNQVYVGGPAEYQAYVQAHPENRVANAEQVAKTASGYRMKDGKAMDEASGRDVSDPFFGATWGELGW